MVDNQAPSAGQMQMQNFWAMTNPKFAAEQMRIQQQQALAQQMMEQGSQQEDTAKLANPGGLVIPNSPWGAAAKAGEKMLGAYMQKSNNEDILKNYQNLSSPQALGAAMGGNGQGSQLSSVMMSDPSFIQNAAIGGVDNATKVWIAQNSPTDQMKNAASNNPLITDEMRNKGLIKGGENYINLPSNIGSPQTTPPVANPPSAPFVSTYGDSSVDPKSPQGQASLANELYPVNESPAEVGNKQPNAMPNPIAGTTPKFDPNSSVDVKGGEKYSEKTSEFWGDMSNKLQQGFMDANSKISNYRQLDNLLTGIDTGAYQGTITDFQKAAARLGFDLPKDVGPVEAAKAISIRLGMEARTEGGSNLLPGATSDYEGQQLQLLKPGIENTTAGRKLMIDFAVRKLTRDQQLANLAGEYEDTNGKLDRKFTKSVKAFVDANPLYKEGEFEKMLSEAQAAQQKVSGNSIGEKPLPTGITPEDVAAYKAMKGIP